LIVFVQRDFHGLEGDDSREFLPDPICKRHMLSVLDYIANDKCDNATGTHHAACRF
jgi:hypothetical protein